MTQKERRIIVISKKNYEELRNLGTITDSFDKIITELLDEAKSRRGIPIG